MNDSIKKAKEEGLSFNLMVLLCCKLRDVHLESIATVYKGIHIKKQNNGLPTY